jgi:hypothetical protein
MKLKKLPKLLWAVLCIIVIIAVVLVVHHSHDTYHGLVPEKNFMYHAPGGVSCDSIGPECGNCYGTLVDKKCYVEPNSRYAQ